MRTRKEIWDEREYKGQSDIGLELEILLDIRDLLQNPPIEIVGRPIHPYDVREELLSQEKP